MHDFLVCSCDKINCLWTFKQHTCLLTYFVSNGASHAVNTIKKNIRSAAIMIFANSLDVLYFILWYLSLLILSAEASSVIAFNSLFIVYCVGMVDIYTGHSADTRHHATRILDVSFSLSS